MKTAFRFRRILLVVVCVFVVFGISITALATYQNNAFDFSINGISPKVEGSYYETIPVAEFTAEVSITNKGSATSIMVLLAAYAENGQMIQAQYQTKTFGANETSVSAFKINNVDGRISALKAFLMNPGKELIPVARSFSLSNLDMVVSAYINEENELVVRTGRGKEVVVSKTGQNSFSDYEIGTKFYLEYPKGEFDIPVAIYGKFTEHTIHVSEIYYELTAINDITDEDAWSCKDITGMDSNPSTTFSRYIITMHIRATTTAELAGAWVTFYISNGNNAFNFDGSVKEDGSITICKEMSAADYWQVYSPRALYFYSIKVYPKT